MSQPSEIKELMYSDGTTVDSTRTTQASSFTTYWMSRNLPSSGKSALDSTIDGNNCEVSQYYFAGHGAGNYVTNFKYYIANRNSVAQDMTHMFYDSSTWVNPSTYTDSDVYNEVSGWEQAPTSVPGSQNVLTMSGYTETSDPTMTSYIYAGVAVEAGKSTGTGTWEVRLLYQYT